MASAVITLLGLLSLTPGAAQAAPGGAQVQMTSTNAGLRSVVELELPAETVLKRVSDPVWAAAASGNGMVLQPLARSGVCVDYALSQPTPIGPLEATVRACRTHDGATINLLESEDFQRYAYRYRVQALSEDRTQLTYELDVGACNPVLAFTADRLVPREARQALETLAHSLMASG